MITVKNLTAGYHGKPVIQDVTLDFIPGEVLVILGPNGSGKSTFLKAVLGLVPFMNGEIRYGTRLIQKMKRKEIAQKAAFLTQNRNTPSIQAFRMVLHGRFPYLSYPHRYKKEDEEIAKEAMEQTGCIKFEKKNISELSGGQRQSVYLAMALAQNTETIFMDEPTTYLDMKHQLQIMKTARALADEGKSAVLVLHDISLALGGADRVAVFDNGKLLTCDIPQHVYQSGILDQVFGVKVRCMDTPDGRQYYCIPKED